MIWRGLAAVALLGLNGFFVAAEFALVAVRETRVQQLADEGNRAARSLRKSLRELSLMLAGAQLGITLASLLLGFTAEPFVARVIELAVGRFIELPSDLLHTISFIVALSIVVFFHMVFGEMVPKSFTISEPERAALFLAVPFRAYVNVFRFVIHVLNRLANAGVRLLGAQPRGELDILHSTDEIAVILGRSLTEGVIPELEHRLLRGALSFRDRDAGAIMAPRTAVVAAEAAVSPRELEAVIRREGRSRIPIYDDDLDHILGFVHAKDLLTVADADRDMPIGRGMIRDMWVVPEQRKLLPLLVDMRRERRHFALVVDEHGGTAGVLSLEDVLEELVGDIRDEHDLRERKLWQIGHRHYLCEGSLRPDEIADETSLHLPEGDYDTVGGFLLDKLGRIPERGARVDYDGWTLRVRAMDGLRVETIELVAPDDTDPN